MTMLPARVGRNALAQACRSHTIVGLQARNGQRLRRPNLRLCRATWKARRMPPSPPTARLVRAGATAFSARVSSGVRRRDRFPAPKTLLLHEPDTYQYVGAGEILPLPSRAARPSSMPWSSPEPLAVKAQFEIEPAGDGFPLSCRPFVEAINWPPRTVCPRAPAFGVGGGVAPAVVTSPTPTWQTDHRPAASKLFPRRLAVDAPLAGHNRPGTASRFQKSSSTYARQRMILEPKGS